MFTTYILFVILLFGVNVNHGWLNFTYTPPAALTYGQTANTQSYQGATFTWTICIDSSVSYISYDYTGPVRALLAVGLGTSKPHIGGTNQSPRRFGNDDPLGKGAYAIIWGNEYDKRNSGPEEWDTYVFEYELNDLEDTDRYETQLFALGRDAEYWGNKLTDCNGGTEVCTQLLSETYDATYAEIRMKRNNIEGDPNHTYQFDETVSYVLSQWAYSPYDFYWYAWEHTHNTRGSYIHHFPTQTVADKKTLTKTLLVDVETQESSGISLALEMDKNTGKITIELWGPSDRWFALGWGGHSEGDALIYTTGEGANTKTLGLYDYAVYGFEIGTFGATKYEGIYPDDAYDGTQDWTQLDISTVNNEVYIKVERLLISTDDTDKTSATVLPKDIDFNINDDALIFFVATANSTGVHELTYHDDNYWIAEVQLTASENVGTKQNWMDAQTHFVNCEGATLSPTMSPITASPTDVTASPTTAMPTSATTPIVDGEDDGEDVGTGGVNSWFIMDVKINVLILICIMYIY